MSGTPSIDRLGELAAFSVDAVVLLDAAGVIQSANAAALDVLGYRADDLAGIQARDLVEPVDRDGWRQLFDRLFDEPAAPVRRYERDKPGEMIHIDIKKLGRFNRIGHRITGDRQGCRNAGAGWEFVHVAIDDHSRVAFARVMPSEKKRSAIMFLKAALAYYESLGIKVERVMTDNGACYKSFAFRRACKRFGLRHIRTRPYTPKTNGKAERFVQTSLREWAYARPYESSEQRHEALQTFIHRYNWHRHTPH